MKFIAHPGAPHQALAATRTPEGAAEMLSCSRANVLTLVGNLEFELGRFVTADGADAGLQVSHFADTQHTWHILIDGCGVACEVCLWYIP